MIIQCEACKTRFVVSPQAIGSEGRQVRCARCSHSWFQTPMEQESPAQAVIPAEDIIDAVVAPPAPPKRSQDKQLPVVQRTSAPGWLKAAAFLLMVTALGGGAVVFEDRIRSFPGAEPVYSALGMTRTDGLELTEVEIQTLPGRRVMRYYVSGKIINRSDQPRTIPMLRLGVADKEMHILEKRDLSGQGETLKPGEALPFQNKLESLSPDVNFILLEIGTTLQLSLTQ